MRLRLNKDQQRQPIGGHHFSENGQTFKDDTFGGVVKKLTGYRLTNGMPMGEPEQDVLLFYAQKWPFMVQEDYADPPPMNSDTITWWMAWIRKQWGKSRGRTITSKEAAIRWETCLKCPHNIKIEPSSPEQKEMARKSFLLRAGQDVPKDLGFCALHRHDTSVAVFTEAPVQSSEKPKDLANYPGCWVA